MNNNRLPMLLGLGVLAWVGIVILLAFSGRLIIHRFGPMPEQPVQFNHSLHVNKLNLECLYCHQYAEQSIHATLPPTQVCRDCHEGADIQRPEAQKLAELLETVDEIPWQRVYKVKDHVYFTHRVHTTVAKLRCQECHGPIEDMTVAIRSAGGSSDRSFLEMGWCITCHKRRDGPRECINCHK
ncbi:cytochrome c3 family protein [candidate division KSB1 bacterium]|nr:cytochrome c3 family protein [candidate division KSB1 bacterium]